MTNLETLIGTSVGTGIINKLVSVSDNTETFNTIKSAIMTRPAFRKDFLGLVEKVNKALESA